MKLWVPVILQSNVFPMSFLPQCSEKTLEFSSFIIIITFLATLSKKLLKRIHSKAIIIKSKLSNKDIQKVNTKKNKVFLNFQDSFLLSRELKMDILLLGYCTRFSCPLIKWCSQLAKLTLPPIHPLYKTPSPPNGWTICTIHVVHIRS